MTFSGADCQVHRAADVADVLREASLGVIPAGEVSLLRDLQCSQHGHIHVSSADHGQRFAIREEAAPREFLDGLATGIDAVLVDLPLCGQGSRIEHADLGLKNDVPALDPVGYESGNAYAEVDISSILQLTGDSQGYQFPGYSLEFLIGFRYHL